MDLRERVVAAVDAGLTQSQAAVRFGVSLRTVERYLARRRATGSLAATQQRHGPQPKVRQQLQAWLPARRAGAADATLAEHAATPARRRRPAGVGGVDVAGDRRPAARSRAAADRGRAPARGAAGEARSLTATERDETARAEWRTQMGEVDPARPVFVEEAGVRR